MVGMGKNKRHRSPKRRGRNGSDVLQKNPEKVKKKGSVSGSEDASRWGLPQRGETFFRILTSTSHEDPKHLGIVYKIQSPKRHAGRKGIRRVDKKSPAV